MSDDVSVLVDEIEAYDDGTVARIRILSVPQSPTFDEGIKYAFHYGSAQLITRTSASTTIMEPTNSISEDQLTSVAFRESE